MRLVVALALAGCTETYLHVTVEGSNPELTAAPADVSVGVYADHKRVDFDYTARLAPQTDHGVPATDFVLLTGELSGDAQLRVSIPTTSTTWFADAKITAEGSLQIPLFAGERAVTNANFIGGDLQSSALFGPGIVMVWVDAGGVEARIERDPDLLISRPHVVVPDASATKLRLTSRPNPLGYGPDLYALAWIGGDKKARLRVTTIDGDKTVQELDTMPDDIAVGAAFKGATYAAAVAQRFGDTVKVQLVDDTGAIVPGAFASGLVVATGVGALSGVVATREGIVVGWRGNDGSHVKLLAVDGTERSDTPTTGDLAALAVSNDGSRILSLESRTQQVVQVSYFANMQPAGIETELGTTAIGSVAALSGCVAAWPEKRDDGTNALDLRYAVLDANGAIVGDSHLLNVEEAGDHLAPTTACASATRAYATFFERAAIGDTTARLRIRRIPTYGGGTP